MPVRERDGIEIELSDGTRVVCDARSPDGDVNVVSHAHSDHTPRSAAEVVCSPLTAALVEARQGVSLDRTTDPRVELLPAGHVAGSSAALITDPDGTRYLYTGDVCTRSRWYLEGFDPPSADVLVVEATYGEPDYVLPDHETVLGDIHSWLDEVADRPVVMLGYALGRAQKLQVLAAEAGRAVYTTPVVRDVNDAIERHRDVDFEASVLADDTELAPGDALVVPSTRGRVDDLIENSGAVTAAFSGWAVDSSYMYRRGVDAAFPLSDHCDFPELLNLADAVDPDRIYTQHGSGGELVKHLSRAGHDAVALKRNQASLSDF